MFSTLLSKCDTAARNFELVDSLMFKICLMTAEKRDRERLQDMASARLRYRNDERNKRMRVDIAVLKAQLNISRDEVADLRAQKDELEKRVMELICEDEMRRSR
jgi:hypothetical protein